MPAFTMDSNNQVFAGLFNKPSWVRNQRRYTWGIIPASNTLADLNPRYNPELNPVYPDKPEWEALGSFAQIIGGWGGGSFDHIRQELRINLPVGHADYAGGEPYGINIKAEVPFWKMYHPPTGALPEAILTNDGLDATGLYANGRPRAVHPYNKCVFIPGHGHAVIPQGSTSWGGQQGTTAAILFDDITGEMSLFGAQLEGEAAGTYSGGAACYDPSRQCVWVRRRGTGRFNRYYPPPLNMWEQAVSESLATDGDNSITYIPEHDCILWMNSYFQLTNQICILDCVTRVHHLKTLSGSAIGTVLNGRSNPAQFEPSKFAFWNNASSTETINVLEFDTHPITGNWSVDQMPVDPENSITPTPAAPNGTFGRWFHSEELGIFGVVNAVNQPTYFYRYK